MASQLTVGKSYNLYTNYESIVGQPVKVIGILSYSECSKISYDINVLAINERVISVKDEDIESEIGSDNIYWCRSLTPNSDGSYNEYLVWDSIINFNRTSGINETYALNFNISISEGSNVSASQISNAIIDFIKSNYSGVTAEVTTEEVTTVEDELKAQIEEAKSVINSINLWGSTLIPAVEKLTNSKLSDTVDDINTKLQVIQTNISMAKHGL